MRIIMLSDLHQDPGEPQKRLLDGIYTLCEKIRADIAPNEGPLIFVLLGDLLNEGKEEAAVPVRDCLNMLYEQLKEYEIMIEAVPGNHDRHGNDISAFDTVLRDIGVAHSYEERSTYAHVYDGINFIFTDTTQEDYNGPGVFDLAAVTAAIDPERENVLFFHHALTHYHVSEHDCVIDGALLSKKLRKLGIRFVFHGHTHQTDVTNEDGQVIEIGCGSMSKSMRDMPEGIYNQFMVAYARDGKILRVDRLLFTGDYGLAIEEAYPGQRGFCDPMKIGKKIYPAPARPHLARRVLTNEASKDEFQRALLGETGKPVREALHEHGSILLLSDSGEGKSVELQNIAYEASESSDFPVLILLKNYLGEPIADLLHEHYNKLHPMRLLLLIDGYDELAGAENCRVFESQLAKYMAANPGVRVLISSRSNFCRAEYGNQSRTLPGFAVYRLAEPERQEQEEYLREKGIEPDTFFKEATEAGVSGLLRIPFYLSGLSDIFLRHRNLPERTAVMDELIHLRFFVDDEKFPGRLADEERKLFLQLQKLALVMQQMHRPALKEAEEYQALFPSLEERQLLKKSGLLEHVGNEVRFTHNNFREYLCAKELLTYSPEERIRLISDGEHVFPSWVNTLGYLCGMNDDLLPWLREHAPEAILKFEPDRMDRDEREALLRELFDYYEERDLWFANDLCDPEELARFACSNNTLDFLLDKLRTPGHPNSKRTALQMLVAFPTLFCRKNEVCRMLLDFCKRSMEEGKGGLCREAVQTICTLHLHDGLVTGELVRLLRYTENVNARCGLYEFLLSTNQQDAFSYVLAEGIAYLDHQGHDTSGEDTALGDALERMSSAHGIAAVLRGLLRNGGMYHYFERGLSEKLLAKGAAVYQTGDILLTRAVIDYCARALSDGKGIEIHACVRFFKETGTIRDAVLGVAERCKDGSWGFGYFLSCDAALFDCAEQAYMEGRLAENLFISAVADYTTDEQYERYRETILRKSGVSLAKPELQPDRTELHVKRIQQYYDMLFDRETAERMLGELIALSEDPEITVDGLLKKHLTLEWDSPIRTLQWTLRRYAAGNMPARYFFRVVNWDEFSFFEAIEQWRKEKSVDPTEKQKARLAEQLEQMLAAGALDDDAIFDLPAGGRGKLSEIVQATVMLDVVPNEKYLLQMVKLSEPFFSNDGNETVKYAYLTEHLDREKLLRQISADLQERRIDEMVIKDHIDFCRKEKREDAVEAATEICCGTYDAPAAQYAAARYLYECKGSRYLEWEVLPCASGELLCVIAKNLKDVSRKSLREEMEKRFASTPTQELQDCLIVLNSYSALEQYTKRVRETHAALQEGDTIRAIGDIRDPALLPLLGELLEEALDPDFEDASFLTLRDSLRAAFTWCSAVDAEAALTELEKHKPNPGSRAEQNKALYYDIESALIRNHIRASDKPKSLEEAEVFLKR